MSDYLKHYQLDIKGISHKLGYIEIEHNKIFTHILQPEKTKGTVIFVHGYLAHSGNFRHLIENLTAKNFSVICLDLPGHGLSDGRKGYIDSFSRYGRIIKHIQTFISKYYHKPYYYIAHSTGCSAYIEYLNRYENIFHKAVLIAPLIRTQFWTLCRTANAAVSPIIKSFPRYFRKTSSNKDYLTFIRLSDPLQGKTITTGWIRALTEWNKLIINCPASDTDIKIIQGNKDIVVDWKYNLSFLNQKFKNCETVIIPGGNHDLCGEARPLRMKVFKEIFSYLE